MTAFRIQYRDRRRPYLGLCLLRLVASDARKAADLARRQLTARGVTPVITSISSQGVGHSPNPS